MGCIQLKNRKCIQQHSNFSLDIPTSDHENGNAQPQLDLPYRHYLGRNSFIPNRPPHFIFKFRGQIIRLNSNIKNSTILLRRIQSVGQKMLKNE